MSRTSGSKDYYAILGAESDAPQEEIERLYKRLAVKHHPDRGGDEEEMKAINEAYGILGNEAERSAYDAERFGRRRSVKVQSSTVADEPAPPFSSPSAQADVFGGRMVGAVLFIAVGLVLLMIVRFQYILFLWPLALLAAFLVVVGVLMAHAALSFARESFAPQHLLRRFVWAQELAFWAAVAVGVYGVYLVLTAI